jgi:hypothetical protein
MTSGGAPTWRKSPCSGSWCGRAVSRDLASILIDDLQAAVDHFTKHPISVSMTAEEASGFSHL